MPSQDSLWSIAVEAPLSEALTYRATSDLSESLAGGVRVQVPLGRRKAHGVVLGPAQKIPDFELKSITSIDPEFPPLPQPYRRWADWVADYYIYAPGLVYSLAYPPLGKQTKARKSDRSPVVPTSVLKTPHPLTQEQKTVVAGISTDSGFSAHLIYGVTGSGKTEVYLELLAQVLDRGGCGVFLVPEISLTPQMIHRFSERFPDQVAVLHSQLTDRERTNQWWEIIEGRKKILIGARSALFCPIGQIGIIIVDEEHEPSFKQDEKLKYNGRDCAIMLAKMHNCPVVLGSATPSYESWHNAQSGKYSLHRLTKRVEDRALPTIQVVDLRDPENKRTELPSWLSHPLHEALKKTLENKKQSALFLNRRGIASTVLCEDCGFIHECPNCDISLTLHGSSHLVCHYCDYHAHYSEECPSCREGQMKVLGLGTEQVEKDLLTLFPGCRVARADRDEIQNRLDLEDLIRKVDQQEVDFLVGTQMIAKGLDFKSLVTVGLVLADVGFNLPDFRSPERSFQLMTQVAGRAGRHIRAGESPGEVYIQTYNPDHPSLVYASQNRYEDLAMAELGARKDLFYPPFGRLAGIRVQSDQIATGQETCKRLRSRAEKLLKQVAPYSGIELLGPGSAPLSRLRNQYRFQMLIKAQDPTTVTRFCRQLLGDESWVPSKSRVVVDIDPIHLL